jgi:branched-subunit amino acid transport protein
VAPVSTVLLCVLVVGAVTIAFKATGPVLLGRRELPAWLAGPVGLLAPAVLAALVVTQAVAGDRQIVADARLAGLGAGAIAVALRAPLLVVVVVAATTAALIRLI